MIVPSNDAPPGGERRTFVSVTVSLNEVWGVVSLGIISLLLVVILGVVVVRLGADLDRLVVASDVVRVELDEREVLLADHLGKALADGRLARARPAGDADEERPRRWLLGPQVGGACPRGHRQGRLGP